MLNYFVSLVICIAWLWLIAVIPGISDSVKGMVGTGGALFILMMMSIIEKLDELIKLLKSVIRKEDNV